MANGDIQKFATMVKLQVASEAFLWGNSTPGELRSALKAGNRANSILPDAHIDHDSGFPNRFELIAHQELTLEPVQTVLADLKSGFSASLFYDKIEKEYTFSIRSTEFDPRIRDAGDIEADIEIASHGWAFSQMYSMEKFWEYLLSGTPVTGVNGINTPDTAKLEAFREAIASGSKMNVTGYSLGGSLATAFTELHAGVVDTTYLFNGAGTGKPKPGGTFEIIWTEYLRVFNHPDSLTPYEGSSLPNGIALAIAEDRAPLQLNPENAIALDSRHLHALDAISDMVVGAFSTSAIVGDAPRNDPPESFNDLIVDIWSEDHLDMGLLESGVATSGIRHGRATPIWYENQPPIYWETVFGEEATLWATGHSIVLLHDSLAIMAAFEELDPTITEDTLGEIFGFSSDKEYSSLEYALNSLARVLGEVTLTQEQIVDDGSRFAETEFRNYLHEVLRKVRISTVFQNLKPDTPESLDTSETPKVAIEISDANSALAAASTDFGQFLTLYYLSPFALTLLDPTYENELILLQGDVGSAWAADRALTESERNQGLATYTDEYLQDRAELLESLMHANEEDDGHGNLLRATKFSDLEQQITLDGDARGYIEQGLGSTTPEDHDPARARYVFGTSEGENLLSYASENDDHLYGMAGADTIQGLDGDDYIEGGADNDSLSGGNDSDILRGGRGNDTLDGESGNDFLVGGQGNDVFHWRTGGGEDTIGDFDTGEDRIFVNDIDLSLLSFARITPDSSFYRAASNPEITLQYDDAELIVNIDEGLDSGQIFVQQYSPLTGADFGIVLMDFGGSVPAPTDFVTTEVKESLSDPDGIHTNAYNRFSDDPIWADRSIRFNAADVANFSSHASDPYQSDQFSGGPNGDHISGDGLSNGLFGDNGNDLIEGGAGRDYLAGGGGSDEIFGGDGNDDIYGSTFFATIENYPGPDNPDGLPYSAQNLYDLGQLFDEADDRNTLDGGAGDDRIHGGEYVDEISGGAGDDRIFGSTGEDLISGGADNDRIYGDSGLVPLTAGNVFQYYKIGWADGTDAIGLYDDVIYGGSGDDLLWGELGNDTIHGGTGMDYLFGDREEFDAGWPAYGSTSTALDPVLHGDDRLYGGADTDTLYGMGGNDLLSGGAGVDYLYGGAGDDTYEYRSGDGRDAIEDTEGQHTLLFKGLSVNDIQIAHQYGKIYVGSNLGLDGFQIEEADWDNVRIAINSVDSIVERSRFDTYYYTDGGELRLKIDGIDGITESQRDDAFTVNNADPNLPRLVVDSAIEHLEFSVGHSSSTTFSGFVSLELFGSPVNVSFDIAPDLINDINYLGDTTLILSGEGDIIGTGGAEQLKGSSSSDSLSGYGGNDFLQGFGGNDTLFGGSGNDTIDGGEGNDTISTVGQGFNTYLFAPGDGVDRIDVEHASRLSPRAPLGDINIDSLSSGDVLEFTFFYEAYSAAVTLSYGNNDLVHLRGEDFKAEDESVLPYFTLSSQSDPTWFPTIRAGAESPAFLFGSFGKDLLLGNNSGQRINPGYGDDLIFAGTGDDTIVLNSMYMAKSYGGIGQKHVVGGRGDDHISTPLAQGLTYYYNIGDGHDTLTYDWSTTVFKNYGITAMAPYQIGVQAGSETLTFTPHGQDTLVFGEGIAIEDLRFLRAGTELLISISEGAGSIQVSNFFVDSDGPTPPVTPNLDDIAGGGPVVDSMESLYHLGLIPENPISKIRLASGAEYDIPNLLASLLEDVGNTGTVTITGTEGDDLNMAGSALTNDNIYGLGGDDEISESGGSNNIYGGTGDDTITVNGGYNYIEGGAGSDLIELNSGINIVSEMNDADSVYIAGGVNYLLMGGGDDSLSIVGGSNTIDMGAGDDDAYISSYYGGGNTIQFGIGHGTDTFVINSDLATSAVELSAGLTVEDLSFRLAPASEYWPTGLGDILGFIEISISASGDKLRLLHWAVINGDYTPKNGSPISELRFSNGEVISGTELWNIVTTTPGEALIGTAASETISGTAGTDLIRGNAGDDTLLGLAGDDIFEVAGVNDGADLVDGGEGFDTIVGSSSADNIALRELTVAHSLERIDGVNGFYNFISGTDSDNVLDFSATELVNIAAIIAGAGNDTITGSQGNDVILGGEGDDTLVGGPGDDIFLVKGTMSGEDRIVGGEGFDTIRGGDTPDNFILSELQATDSVDQIDGGTDFFNFVSGTNADDTLNFVATEFLNIVGISGGDGNDQIVGTNGNEIILGGAGDDTLIGANGDDTLWGGSGDDTYFFLPGAGTDTILNADSDPESSDVATFAFSTYDSLWFSQDTDDLLIDLVGSNDQVRVTDWFAEESSKLSYVNASSGVLLTNQLDTLVSEMAAFDVPMGVGAIIPPDTRSALEPALAAAWQLS